MQFLRTFGGFTTQKALASGAMPQAPLGELTAPSRTLPGVATPPDLPHPLPHPHLCPPPPPPPRSQFLDPPLATVLRIYPRKVGKLKRPRTLPSAPRRLIKTYVRVGVDRPVVITQEIWKEQLSDHKLLASDNY